MRILCFLLCAVCAIVPAHAQQAGNGLDRLDRYAACKLPGGPDVVETAPLGAGGRSVPTRKGSRSIAIEAGKRIMFAYPGEAFYANVKAERLPAATYAEGKQLLIDSFDYTLAQGHSTRNYGMKPVVNGYPLHGLDVDELKGGVLGIYLLFDDDRHEVLTVYFLNQQPQLRFHTLPEYAQQRDRFLTNYTACLSASKPPAP